MKKSEASLAIQVLPNVDATEDLSAVDKVIEYLISLNLNAFVAPFETTIEGSLDQIFDAAKQCQKICIENGARGVSSYIKIAYNPTEGVYGINEKTKKYKQ